MTLNSQTRSVDELAYQQAMESVFGVSGTCVEPIDMSSEVKLLSHTLESCLDAF